MKPEKKDVRKHYQSLRRQRVRNARRLAQHTEAEWLSLLIVLDGCVSCHSVCGGMTKDHIFPICRGGSDGLENLQPLCRSCNSRKGSRIWGDLRPTWWRESLVHLLTFNAKRWNCSIEEAAGYG